METDAARWARIEAVLDAALDLAPVDRAVHVAGACGGDAALERDVLALLAADARAEGFLEPPSSEHIDALVGDDAPAALAFVPGRLIGAYRLTGVIGEGGMGVVYDAERADGQFESHVALKVLRWVGAGDDARRRFLRERQILAQLEHPHIARLLDGGVTDDGVPYFVMERVTPGTPLTTYCEEHQLGVEARLSLILQACDAVQHAHRVLVVHRDLKPTNIVVDATGSVKLLDFGIAKLLAGDDAPFATVSNARPMTPAFAAPEQVAGAPITTATDVYALGVVLYVVLTGRLPYDVDTGRVTDWARAVLDTVPKKPSAAATEPRRATRLRGDLDRIVLKALEKEPAQRYASVEALASDIQRHLAGLPVTAHAASRWYRARKLVGRNRLLVAGVAATMLALSVGLGATVWQSRKAQAQARRAEAVQAFLVSVFEEADPDRAKGVELTAKEILARGSARIDRDFPDQPDVRAALWAVLLDLHQKLGDYRSGLVAARGETAAALAAYGSESLDYGRALRRLADAFIETEDVEAAVEPLARAMPIIRRTAGERSDEMIEALTVQGEIAIQRGRRDEAVAAHRRAVEIARQLHGADSEDAARIENDLVVAIGSSAEALALAQHVTGVYRRAFGAESYMHSVALYNEGFQLYDAGRWREAMARFGETLPIQEKLLGSGHAKTALTYRQLARLASMSGDFGQARTVMGRAIAALEAQFGAASTAVALAKGQMANIERMSGRYAEGIVLGRQAVAALDVSRGAPGNLALVLMSLGAAYRGHGDIDAALQAGREAVRLSESADARWLGASLMNVGAALVSQGGLQQAGPVLRRAIDTLRAAQQGQSPACAEALKWLADAGAGTMTNADRDAVYKESLALFAAVAPAEQADALDAGTAYAAFLKDTDRAPEARRVLAGVLDAFTRSTGLEPARTQAALELRAELSQTTGSTRTRVSGSAHRGSPR